VDWHVTFRVFRYKQDGQPPGWQEFVLEVRPTDYVVDALERIWAEHDRSFIFRHACHHAACGACGVRINGHEHLACNTRIDTQVSDGGVVTVEPLQNLPVLSDLVVNPALFYERMELIPFIGLQPADPIIDERTGETGLASVPPHQFANCIECALCFSTCPARAVDSDFAGPAALAAMSQMLGASRRDGDPRSPLEQAGGRNALRWRIRAASESVFSCLLCQACEVCCPRDVHITEGVHSLRRFLLKEGW